MDRVYRDPDNGIWLGVFEGLGQHFDEDPVILRMLFCVFLFATGLFPAIVIYVIAAMCIPDKDQIE